VILTIDDLARHIAHAVYDRADWKRAAGDYLSELEGRHRGALGAAARRVGTSATAERRFFAKVERAIEAARRLDREIG